MKKPDSKPSKGKNEHPPSGRPIPVRFKDDALAEIAEAAEKLEMSQQDIIRLATKIGLKDLNRIKFDLAEVVYQAAKRESEKL